MPWGLVLPLPEPQAGEPEVGLRTLTPVGEPLRYISFPVCGSPTGMWFDFIAYPNQVIYEEDAWKARGFMEKEGVDFLMILNISYSSYSIISFDWIQDILLH